MRGRHGQFPEYHTSDDNLDFVTGESLAESLELLARVLGVVDRNRVLRSLEPYGEPQLGRRGLYGALGSTTIADAQLTMLWILNLSDGAHSLLDVAERAGVDFEAVVATAEVLERHGLVDEVSPAPR
jgi:aminopeptidase-like protein